MQISLSISLCSSPLQHRDIIYTNRALWLASRTENPPGAGVEQAGMAAEQAGLAAEKAGLAAKQAGLAAEQAGLAAEQAVLAAVAQVAPPLSEGPHKIPHSGKDPPELVLQHLLE